MTAYRGSKAIVLRRHDSGEYDRRYVLFTERYGKIIAIGRGTHKITSKLAGSLEPGQLIDIQLAAGKQRDTIIAAEVINSFRNARKSEVAMAQAAFVSEVIHQLIEPEQNESAVWELTVSVMNELDRRSMVSKVLGPYFIVRLLALLGTGPNLDHCGKCRSTLKEEEHGFDQVNNYLLCQKCKGKGNLININAVKALRLFSAGKLPIVKRLKLAEHDVKEISRLALKILNNSLNYPLVSIKVLNDLSNKVNK
ncbi:MAG: DNA repair protein RecO [Patescibacteria group bacterium]